MSQPLADLIRPTSLDDIVGQSHLLSKNSPLRRIIESKNIPNMIFYGPSGTGKTTLAGIIAKMSEKTLYKINATSASSNDIKEVISKIGSLENQKGILIYIDEIQYFSKKQQQLLLEYIENGDITLIASTTENPYFYIYNALLSRCTVFEFKPLSPEDVQQGLRNALHRLGEEDGVPILPQEGALELLASACGGDMRKALGCLEFAAAALPEKDGVRTLTEQVVQQVTQRAAQRYDKSDDMHYDCISALQKSIRGSDPDAAVHYLARILEGGDMLSACRRLLVIAAEDVGLAYPQAIPIVKACVDSALQLGLPEARLPLADAAILLATAPKSNSAHNAILAAMEDLRKGRGGPVPRQLQNRHFDGEDNQNKGQHYLYPHDYPNHWVAQQYLPDALVGTKYYEYGENKTEQAAKAYWEKIKGR